MLKKLHKWRASRLESNTIQLQFTKGLRQVLFVNY